MRIKVRENKYFYIISKWQLLLSVMFSYLVAGDLHSNNKKKNNDPFSK